MPLIYLSCAWVIGIFLGANFNLPAALVLTGLLPLPFLFLRRYRKTIILASLILTAIFAAAAYSYASQNTINERQLRFYNDTGTVEIRGIISADPEVRNKVLHLRLSVRAIKSGGSWQPAEGTTLVFVPRYPAFQYGDELELKGRPETPSPLADFDYRGYLAHHGIYTTITYPRITLLAQDRGSTVMTGLYSLRRQLAQTLAAVLPEPQASLAEAIVLGIREAMPQTVKDDFARTGTTHLLAISGLNLTIIAGIFVSAGIRLFGKKHYLYVWLALALIWIYALLTAMSPPVVRGAIMASIFLFAELLGRQRSAITAITFAAAVMVGINPYLLGDASFQLSFLAMAGLIFLAPALQNLGRTAVQKTIGEDGALVAVAAVTSDSLAVSLAAIIAVWPVVAYYFGIFSPVGPLATLLALPAIPLIIILGIATALLGIVALPLAQALGWLTWLCLSYLLLVVNLLARPALATIGIGFVIPAFIAAYYAVLAALIWFKSRRRDTASLKAKLDTSIGFLSRLSLKWVLLPLFIIAIMTTVIAATMPDGDLHVSFLDVGEGDAILISKGSQQVLIDGGPGAQALNLALGSKMPFWDRTIDMVILTHPHADHLAGLVDVLQRYDVKQVLCADTDDNSPAVEAWRQIVTAKAIKSTNAQSGQQIDLGDGARLEVLHPPAAPLTATESDVDNNSVVLRLVCGEVSLLFTADIMSDAERALILTRAELASTVLKVAHHGSATSTTNEFLTVVNPQIAVISVGADNKFGHPNDEVMQRLETSIGADNIYRTDLQGTLEFITDGAKLWVKRTKGKIPHNLPLLKGES